MSQFKMIFRKTPLIALAALPLTVGTVLAQQSSTAAANPTTQAQPQRIQPAQPGQRNQNQNGRGQQTQRQQGSGTNYADIYLQKLAAGLGVSVDKLKAAALAAGNATIDQGVKSGDIASNRAADMKTRLKDQPFAMLGGRGMGGPGGPGRRGMHGPDGRDGGRGKGPRGTSDGTDGTRGQANEGTVDSSAPEGGS
ncbi:hypothetical protein GCM10010840_26180 [Deinococcus aerolatus]|uniref:Uncharacterized protein n=1 Tax=Deinococcus aerolatus TaxID=522487 RepID=A0ABQ2GE23_9DEIO|nr:hypothetical protein [Deinococcus aerolatus]GGL87049.1 hypothetical protein GCM10010840_26180 [Deinococcus aerolatus]